MFLKTNLTTPKIRDLVEKPVKQYDTIYTSLDTINNTEDKKPEEQENMKNELQNYLKELSVKTEIPNKIITSNEYGNNFSPQFEQV